MAALMTGYPRVPPLCEGDRSVQEYKWTLTTADPTGDAIHLPEWADCTLSMLKTGTTEGGSTLALQTAPENVDADFYTCKSAAGGAAIALTTAPAGATAIERSNFMRPKLTTPGVGATVVCHLLVRRTNPMRT